MRNLGQIMDIIPELFRALEENLGLYKHENTLVLFLSIFPERYWNNHPWLSLLHIVIVRLLCFQGTPILYNVLYIIKLDIFSAADKVWITELTLIHKNIRSVCNSHAQELILILKIIVQCDDKHILTSQIKTIMPVGLTAILAIMSVSTFKTVVILYLLHRFYAFVCINKTYPKGNCFPLSNAKWYFRLGRRSYCDVAQWSKRLFYSVKYRLFFHLEISALFLIDIYVIKQNIKCCV